MKTEIIPLGTASAIPTGDRHMAALALQRQGEILLFDCGEGTQFQLVHAGLKRTKISAVFITHFHGDHFYGLMGLLSTLGLLERTQPLTVVGPARTEDIVSAMPGLRSEDLPYPVNYVEIGEEFTGGLVWQTDDMLVRARPLAHRVFTLGYRWEEKPRPGHLQVDEANRRGVTEHAHFRQLKRGEPITLEGGVVIEPEDVVGPPQEGAHFAYVTDTRPCEAGRELARGVDLLYHEATFAEALKEKACATAHSTASEAAQMARDAGAERLLIGHFSARYTDPAPLVREAVQHFPNTEAAEELKRYAL